MRLNKLLTILFLLLNTLLFAQEKCGTMDLLKSHLAKNNISFETFKKQLHESKSSTLAAKNREVFTIPCVVHVIYRNQTQNISNDIIYEAIAVLNEDFRALNNLSNIYEEFQDDAADAEIEFCLANIDPYGKPTTGINRVKTTQTNLVEYIEKESGEVEFIENIKFTDDGGQDAWPTKKYLNIWIGNINNEGLLGFAQFPGIGDSATDGIVIDDRSFGRAGGASNVTDDGTTSHEIGHWLGLRHIWGDCYMDMNGVEVCSCTDTDNIDDTNNAQGPASGCQPQSRSCGTPDMIQNFMDYSSCSDFFTQGQVDEMRMYLMPDGFRKDLFTTTKCAELIADDLAVIEIQYPSKNGIVCRQNFKPIIEIANNGTDTLTQASFKILINDNKEYTYNWTGELLFAEYETIELTEIEGNIGSQEIMVKVEQVNGVEDTNTNNNEITYTFQVRLFEAKALPFIEEFETANLAEDKWRLNNNHEDESFTITSEVTHFGIQCLQLNNFDVKEEDVGKTDELISQNLNMASYTEPELRFYYASANRRTEPGTDELQVLFTNDCGIHFDTLFQAIGDDLATTSKTDEAFKPVGSQWKRVSIDLAPYQDETFANIHFKFINGLGNNFYLDDINVFGKEPIVGIEDESLSNEFVIYPNPFQQMVYVSVSESYQNKEASIQLYNALGKQMNKSLKVRLTNQTMIDTQHLPTGIYYINIQINETVNVLKKVIKL